jgi:hypothetical protein
MEIKCCPHIHHKEDPPVQEYSPSSASSVHSLVDEDPSCLGTCDTTRECRCAVSAAGQRNPSRPKTQRRKRKGKNPKRKNNGVAPSVAQSARKYCDEEDSETLSDASDSFGNHCHNHFSEQHYYNKSVVPTLSEKGLVQQAFLLQQKEKRKKDNLTCNSLPLGIEILYPVRSHLAVYNNSSGGSTMRARSSLFNFGVSKQWKLHTFKSPPGGMPRCHTIIGFETHGMKLVEVYGNEMFLFLSPPMYSSHPYNSWYELLRYPAFSYPIHKLLKKTASCKTMLCVFLSSRARLSDANERMKRVNIFLVSEPREDNIRIYAYGSS